MNSGYTWYRQGKEGGTTNANINNSMLYAFTDPTSPAGGISIEGWKTLWAYCAGGVFTGDSYCFDPLNRGDVQIGTFYSSSLSGKIDAADIDSDHPLKGYLEPENWNLVDIADGTYYIAEYIGILDKAGRTEEETEAVKAFVNWFGSAELQAAWAELEGSERSRRARLGQPRLGDPDSGQINRNNGGGRIFPRHLCFFAAERQGVFAGRKIAVFFFPRT